MAEPDLSAYEEAGDVEALRKANHTLQRQLQTAKAKTAELIEAVYQAAKDAAVIQGPPPPIPKPKTGGRKRAEVGLLLASDWHVGKATRSFSSEVAVQRVRRLGEKVAQLTEIERADHPVRECHVLVAGDMADGSNIFPGHAFEVDSTAFSQVFTAAGALEALLRHMLAVFPTVHVWEQTGNHGRLGKRGEYPRSDNLDRLIYRITQERFSGIDRLVWHEARSWFTIAEMGAYRVLLVHGDQIRSFGGNIPAFGIARKANAWSTGVLGEFSDVMMGHYHQALTIPLANGSRVFVNPSIESDSEYAREFVAATGTPGQRLFYVDPDRGRITSERVVWLDD